MERQAGWDETPIVSIPPPSQPQPEKQIWDGLYSMRGSGMFKPRRYILKAFPELEEALNNTSCGVSILDCGSGNGASIFPLLAAAAEHSSKVNILALDLSSSALELLTQATAESNVETLQFDLTSPSPPRIVHHGFDFSLLIFTLSAILPEFHLQALQNSVHHLRVGGKLLFRDYGWMDMIQVRCKQRVGESTVCKTDGVWCTFFTVDSLHKLFASAGLRLEQPAKYCTVRNINRKSKQELKRVFIQAVGVKM